jgi:beta-glucosidase
MSGEAASRAYLDVPGAQGELVEEVGNAGKPMVLVMMAGRPLTFHALAEKVGAVLWAWHPGSEGGPAIAETLFGESVPSGKLTVTFPRTVGQEPMYYDHMNTGRPAEETGPYADEHYTSKYLDVSFTPEYPFGFGKSYTAFKYSDLKMSSNAMNLGGELTVSANVANTGTFDGVEIVQLYSRQLVGSLTRPVRELRDFRRVMLKAGEAKRVEFVLKADELAYFNGEGKRVTEPGQFDVWIAPDSASGLMGEFTLAGAGAAK